MESRCFLHLILRMVLCPGGALGAFGSGVLIWTMALGSSNSSSSKSTIRPSTQDCVIQLCCQKIMNTCQPLRTPSIGNPGTHYVIGVVRDSPEYRVVACIQNRNHAVDLRKLIDMMLYGLTSSMTPATRRRVSVLLKRPPHVLSQFFSFFMSMVAFSLTSQFAPMICQTKTLPSLEQVTNRSPVCEKATWRTWDEKTMITGMVKAGFNLISVAMQHCGKDSGCLIDESFVLVQPSRSTFPQPAKPVRRYKKEKRNHLVEENLREKSLQRRRFHRGPSLDAANHWEQTRPEANV